MSDFHFSPRPNRAEEIRWREWSDAAFDEAKRQDKPILLAISAVWCHWCHVMDETTYSSQDVIDAINARFIPVRVDNDRRPDVNARYNQGGWPTTVILTPDGEVLKGATYLPPDHLHQLLAQIDAFYANSANRSSLAKQIGEVKARRAAARPARAGLLKPDIPDRVFSFLDANFDEEYGGFGMDQKFPQTNTLHFLLDLWARRRDLRARDMVQKTLHAMAGGGMYDHVHGGFYRYSTTRDFSVPHFEKMLEDLGGLLLACARASAMFGDETLGRVAIEVRSYLDARLWNPRFDGYGGSQDADEEYYALDASGRSTRQEPYVDPTVYASWNAQTARALIVAGPLLFGERPEAAEWTARGLRVLESMWSKLSSRGMMQRYYDGTAHVRGLLGDQVWTAWAALAALEATGETRWLDRARALVESSDSLYEAGSSGYVDRLPDAADPGRLTEPSIPFDDNALMARVLLGLSFATGDKRWAVRARSMLEAGAESYRSYGTFAAGYGSAVLDCLEPPLDVKIVGPRDGQATASLRGAARRHSSPPVRIDSIDPVRDADRLAAMGHVPLVEDSTTAASVAYVCDNRSCFARAIDSSELEAALSHARA